YIDSLRDSERVRRDLLVMHPVGRLGDPRDIGNLAVWLASEESSFVTGQVYVVDGGRTKKLPLPVSLARNDSGEISCPSLVTVELIPPLPQPCEGSSRDGRWRS